MICSPHSRSPWRTWQSWYVIIWQSDWLFPSNGIQGRTSASSRHLLFKVVTFPALGTMKIRLYWSLWTQVNSGPSIQPFDNRCPPLEQSMTVNYGVCWNLCVRAMEICLLLWVLTKPHNFHTQFFYMGAFSNWKVFRLKQTELFSCAHNFVKKAAWQAGGTLETCLNGILGVKWTHEGLLMDVGTHLSVADSSVKSKRFRLSGRYTKTKNSLSQWQYVQK